MICVPTASELLFNRLRRRKFKRTQRAACGDLRVALARKFTLCLRHAASATFLVPTKTCVLVGRRDDVLQ